MLQKILARMRRAIEDYHMIKDGDKIAVGVSGGKDSQLLLLAFRELQKFLPQKFEFVAICRPGSKILTGALLSFYNSINVGII